MFVLSSTFATGAPEQLGEAPDVVQAAFNGDASRVITRTGGGTIGLWEAKSGLPVSGELNAPGAGFITDAGGRNVLVCQKDGGARIFDTTSGKALSPPLDVRFRDPAFPEAVFSPDSTQVLIFEPEAIAVFTVASGERLARLPIRAGTAEEDLDVNARATFTKDGRQCFVMDRKGTVTPFDARTWKPTGAPLRHPAADLAYNFGFAVSDDGRWVATFDDPGENGPKSHLQPWDVAKGKPLGKPLIAVNGFGGAFLPSSNRLLVLPGRGDATVLDFPALKKSATIRAHDEVDGPRVAASPDGKWLVSWGADQIVRLHVAATGVIQESQLFHATITQVLLLPDSSGCVVVFDNSAFLLQNHYDHYVLRLSFPDMTVTDSLRITEPVNRVVLSPDGHRLLVQSGPSKKERVWLFETAGLKPVVP